MRSESLDFLKNLADAPSPSGYEQPAAKVFREYAGQFAHAVRTDVHGNVWAVLNPDAKSKVMLSGHMDEIGFIIVHITDAGLLHIGSIGGHDTAIPLGQRVWVHSKERIPGVIARKPIHMLSSSEREAKPELHEMTIDIGAKDKAEAESLVSIGDPVTYQWEFARLAGDRAVGRGIDNKVGAFAVIEALRLLASDARLDPGVGVYAVATVQEEIGLRGARTAAFGVDAQSGLAVDVDFATDQPGVDKGKFGSIEVGKGPSVTRGANINPRVFEMVVAAAREDGIAVQLAAEGGATGTDANAMQVTRSGMATGLVGVPIRYMHSPCELFSLTDADNCAKLMAAYCAKVKPDTDFTP